MSFFRLFSLETLDLRFVTSAKDPLPRQSKREPDASSNAIARDAQPSLWRTPEFMFYYLVFLICIPSMFKAAYDVSQPSHPNYHNYEHLLSPGWINGRKVDNSDTQYGFFRNNIPYLFLLLVLHPTLRVIYNTVFPIKSAPAGSTQASDARLEQRLSFDFLFGLILITILHGFSAAKVLLILFLNYSIAKKLPANAIVPVTWLFNITTLFANELCAGYPYQNVLRHIPIFAANPTLQNLATTFDGMGGLVSRWEVLFNITVLRLISFNADYRWSLDQPRSIALEKQLDPANLSERDRIAIPPPYAEFKFRNYLSYTLYAPLYLTGPILTFNDFIAQARAPVPSVSIRRTTLYGVRFLLCLLTMEFMLHYIYVVAISKANPAWEVYSPLQVSMLGYFNLHIIWMKLLLPWRFFRFWALVDGVDAPENMVRCMSNNYSALGFWRNWHRSYNRWITRYIYIPLGGSRPTSSSKMLSHLRVAFNYVVVFTFVALWHDINLRLLMWGWLITLFIMPEVFGTLAFPERKWKDRPTTYRVLCGLGAVANILMMMIANLVGFALGLDGLQGLINGIIGSFSGVVYFIVACGALFVGAQMMFETRQEEQRKGIKMNC